MNFNESLKHNNVLGSWPGTLGILRDGSTSLKSFKRPVKSISIYEYEASPYCRKVREAVSLLDLTVTYKPCPGARYQLFFFPIYPLDSQLG